MIMCGFLSNNINFETQLQTKPLKDVCVIRTTSSFFLQEKAQLKVDVFDVDDNNDDKVDFLYGNFTLSAAKNKKMSRSQSFRLASRRTL